MVYSRHTLKLCVKQIIVLRVRIAQYWLAKVEHLWKQIFFVASLTSYTHPVENSPTLLSQLLPVLHHILSVDCCIPELRNGFRLVLCHQRNFQRQVSLCHLLLAVISNWNAGFVSESTTVCTLVWFLHQIPGRSVLTSVWGSTAQQKSTGNMLLLLLNMPNPTIHSKKAVLSGHRYVLHICPE